MRKITVFLVLIISILVFFSCDFQLPKAIEVFGNADLKFSAQKDIGETFADMFPKVDDYDVIKCVNTETRTYILHSILLQDSDYNLSGSIPPYDINFTTQDDTDIGQRELTIAVEFDDSVLMGFSLKPVAARVFIYGESDNQQLVSKLAVKINIETADGESNEYTVINNSRSDIDKYINSNDECSLTSLPGKPGSDIFLPLSNEELKIDFKVYVPKDTVINPTWFTGQIFTEILVWVPLEFTADNNDDDNKISISIPQDILFSEGKDLFGRGSKEEENTAGDYIESLELSIILNKNPFEGRTLIIWSGDDYESSNIKISNVLKGKAFNFKIDEETMKSINEPINYPFAPNFRIEYEPGDELKVPWDIKSSEFVFKAKINYRKEF